MRVIDTFAHQHYKVTLFQTSDRYLVQIEDEHYLISWKISKSYSLDQVKKVAVDKMQNTAPTIWPKFQEQLKMPPLENHQAEFPQII